MATPSAPSETSAVEDELLQDLLLKTSRTFALAIPLLPEPTLREVTIAYLLFRIADTFEDASVQWSRRRQIEALDEFVELVRHPDEERARRSVEGWLAESPSDHEGYLELLERTPDVFRAFVELSPEAREIVARHTIRTAEGMASIVERSDENGVLRLESVADLQEYCYIVAGIVGELLTDLFILESEALAARAAYLRERAARFGEGLQLTNILKDSASDAVEGRNYLPGGVGSDEIFALARADLEAATEYILAIQEAGGPEGVVLFTGLTVALAWPTLVRVERNGPGAKLTRPEVFQIQARLFDAVAEGRPAVEVPARPAGERA